MNYSKYPIIIASLVLFVCSACVKDLDTVPLTNNEITTENAWEQPETYEAFVAKIYAGFALSGNEGPAGMPDIVAGDQGEATFLRAYWTLQEIPTDEAAIAWADDGLDGLQFTQWNSSNRFVELNYNRTLLNIAYCNEYLRQTTDEQLTARGITDAALRSRVEGFRYEVRVLRALNYYFLIDLYANVPFLTEENGVGVALPEQKDRTFLFSWVESELKAVEGHLPAVGRANYGKVNDPTAWMILAKLYLNAEVYIGQQRYTECLTYLNKILQAGYILDGEYKHTFGADNDLSTEIIYPIVFDGKRATTYGGTTFLMAAAFGSDMNPGTNFGLAQSWSGTRAKETLSALFDAGDKRALFWTDKRTQETTDLRNYNQGWAVTKFTNLKRDGSPGSDNLFADTDFPLFRLGDVYLMYAEAVLRGGQGGSIDDAMDFVNELRLRADVGLLTATSQLTLPFILDERARELYWEGHRRTDLIRFNRFTKNYAWPWKNGVFAGTASIDDKYKLYPLPASELAVNTNLTQNPDF